MPRIQDLPQDLNVELTDTIVATNGLTKESVGITIEQLANFFSITGFGNRRDFGTGSNDIAVWAAGDSTAIIGTADRIPDLPGTKIISTLNSSVIPNISADLLTSGSVDLALLPRIPASNIDNFQQTVSQNSYILANNDKNTYPASDSAKVDLIQVTQLIDLDATTTSISNLESGKQDTLTFDTTPTESSTNPVTSGGIFNSLDGFAPTASPDFTGTIDITESSRTATIGPSTLVIPNLPGLGSNLAIFPDGTITKSGAGHPVGFTQTSLAIADLTGLADGTIASTPTTNLVYVDVDLNSDNNFLFHTGTQAFTVPNGNFGVLRGEYVLLARATQANANDPFEISQTTYFVGRVEDFRVNITTATSTFQFPAMGTQNVIGAQGTIPAQTVRLAMSEIALSNELAQNVAGLAMIDDWFIRPADALDSLGNIRSVRQPYTNITWLGDFNGFTPPATANTSRDVRIRLSRDASNNEVQHVVAAPAFAFGATLPQPADSSAGDFFYLNTAGQQTQRVALTAGGTAVTFDGVAVQDDELGAGTSTDGQTGPITRVEWSAGRSTWDDFTTPTNTNGNAFTGNNPADTGTSFGLFLEDGTELIWAGSQNVETSGVPADRLDWLRGDFNNQNNVALFNDITTTRQVGLYVFTTQWERA